MLRIKKDCFYVIADHPGISGFKDWSKTEVSVVTGLKARNRKSYVAGQYATGTYREFRCDDGHLPEYQPRMTEEQAMQWLCANPFAAIIPIC